MRYMLLIYGDESQQVEAAESASGAGAAAAATEVSPPWIEYTNWLDDRGINVAGERLASSATATTVRLRDGNRLITDGPFAETKEVLGGYYIIECRDLDEALEAAARCPGAAFGSVEVRPLVQMAGMTGPGGVVAGRAASSGR
jgi:hypothetical protein